MSRNFQINDVLINEISLGPAPKNYLDIDTLKSKGIKSVLSLCSSIESPFSKEFKKYFVHKRIVLPDHKTERSVDIAEIYEAINLINLLYSSLPIYIHCLAGVERSPLICMAWLMKNNKLSFQEAFDYLIQVNPSTNPMPEQFITLRDINFNQI